VTGSPPFRFGVQLRGAATRLEWVEKARKAEALGYAVATMPDHISGQLAPVPALAVVAASTSSLRIGTMVLSNDWRNPVLVAREAATLDLLSEGRLELGIGAGWDRHDYAQLGVPYGPPGVRVARMEQAVDIILQLLEGATVTHSDRFYQLEAATCTPLPVQLPHPPLVIGGGSRRVLSMAGRLADIAHIHTNLSAGQQGGDARPNLRAKATAERVQWVRDAAHERSATPELGIRVIMASVTDRRATRAAELGQRWNLSSDEVFECPQALVGSIDGMAEDLMERREKYGFSFIVWGEEVMEELSPLVSRLG
jgi:probable F420-dependent oxidoreductase